MKKFIIILCLFLLLGIIMASSEQADLIFSHKYHAEEVEASCSACHEAAFESKSPNDNLLPDMETCYDCHDEDETECSYCHIDPDEAREVTRIIGLKAKFPHKAHAESDEDCLVCHKGITQEETPKQDLHIPSNDICINCHGAADYNEEKERCLQCHEQDFHFIPADHTNMWKKNHGLVSQIDENSCSHCHQNTYCVMCHEGDNLDRMAHPLNYRNSHGIHAKGNKDNCLTCHQEYAFCIECHQTELVMPRNHSFANWANTVDGGRHAREALYDFDSCSSCHNDAFTDNICLRCHR
jgi:predicted CXXCH cytochrome family protein